VRLQASIFLHSYGRSSALPFNIFVDHYRTTARLLKSELLKDGVVDQGVMEQLCKVFDGGELMVHIAAMQLTRISMCPGQGIKTEAQQSNATVVHTARIRVVLEECI
jgi:hypothetical protein